MSTRLIHLEMMGLATFNEKNIAYRNYIKSAIKSWLDAGVDALRVDTLPLAMQLVLAGIHN